MSDSYRWIWSPVLKTYYRISGSNGIVTREGKRLPLSALSEPRKLASAKPIPERYTEVVSAKTAPGPGNSKSSSLSTSPTYITDQVSYMDDMMKGMGLSTPRTASDTAIHRGVDKRSHVQSAIKFLPKKDITQPDLKDDAEFLDQAYRVRKQPNKFFVFGRIFLVLWAEPAGANSLVTSLPITGIIPGRHNEQIYSKVRRFVVIRPGDRSCSALPILTYDHQGAKKRYMNASENGIIFTGKDVPANAPRVSGLLGSPIRVNTDDPTDKLDAESLIHYGKIYTVEHNVKVKPLGMVHDDYMNTLQQQFRDVWVQRMELPRSNPNSASIPRSANSQGGRTSNVAASGQGSDIAPSRQPRQLTDRQRAALEQHGAVADRLRRNPSDAGGRSVRQSDRGSGNGSEAAESSAAGNRRGAAALYLRLHAALLAQGCDEEEAVRRAREGVRRSAQAASQRATAEQQRDEDDTIESGDESRSDRDDGSGSGSSAGSPPQSQPSAMDIIMARGYTREQARRMIADATARRTQGTGRGKERQT
nr:hypothetical protein B0A51_03186 [Rachicladosporium sp. CCFEE 5018]